MEKKIVDQREYLKKYLSSGNRDDMKKKKKKKTKTAAQKVKIIDDDIDLKNMRPIHENEFEIFIDAEDAPQIAGVVDERGPVDFTDKRRWKIIADDQGEGLTITSADRDSKQYEQTKDDDLSPPRISKKQRDIINKESKWDDCGDTSPSRIESKTYDHGAEVAQHKRKKKTKSKEKASVDSDDSVLPRRNKKHKSDKSIKYREANSDSDLSPPRNSRKDSDSDMSPPRKSKNYDSDLSPPRKSKKLERGISRKYEEDSDLSPPRRSRKNSDSDSSPPRKSKKQRGVRDKSHNVQSDSDLSPPRKSMKNVQRTRDSDTDPSPPRRKHEKHEHASYKHKDKNYEPGFRSQTQSKNCTESYSDVKRNRYSNSSPPRQHRYEDERTEGNRSYKHSERISRSDRRYNDPSMSLLGKKNVDRDADTSPSRSRRDNRDFYKSKANKSTDRASKYSHKDDAYSKEKKAKHRDPEEEINEKRMKKTLDGKRAGLQDAKALREETEAYKKREAEQFSKLSKEVTGVGQAAILRDTKTGRKRNLEAEAAEEREKQRRQAELDEKYAKWGRGLKQVEDREEKLKDDLYEMSKPLARYADDADLDKRLREQEREGDPMLEYIKQKQIKEGKRKPDRPAYEGSFMPNRFGIKPGHRWDGVDRSNGYEKLWFEAQNAKLARQEEAYKWSTSDM